MDLMANVEDLKGVGPKTAEILKKFGIKTVRDFFYNLPNKKVTNDRIRRKNTLIHISFYEFNYLITQLSVTLSARF